MKKPNDPKILLTRPQNEALETASFLKKNGFEVLSLPLFAPIPQTPSRPFDLENTQAWLATSPRAVQFFSKMTPHRTVPLYAVGDQTALQAKNLGFQKVLSASGAVHDLLRLVEKECSPEKGEILYISGALTNHDISQFLGQKGFHVRREILYAMEPLMTALPPSLISSFEKGETWGTLFYSSQAASFFLRLMRQAGLGKNCAIGYLFCLSQAVADHLTSLGGEIKIAQKPNQASLLEIINDTIPPS